MPRRDDRRLHPALEAEVELYLLVELHQQMPVQTAGYRVAPPFWLEMKNHKMSSFTLLEGQRLRAYAGKDVCVVTRRNQWPLVLLRKITLTHTTLEFCLLMCRSSL